MPTKLNEIKLNKFELYITQITIIIVTLHDITIINTIYKN